MAVLAKSISPRRWMTFPREKKNSAGKGRAGDGGQNREARDTEESESMCFVPLPRVIHPSYLIV